LESKAYIGTCFTEEGVLQTWNYSDIKKAYQRHGQLSVEYEVDDQTQALRLLYNQFIQSDDFAEQVEKCEAAFDALVTDKAKRGRARCSTVKVNISGSDLLGICAATFDPVKTNKPKRGRGRSAPMNVTIQGTQDDNEAVTDAGCDPLPEPSKVDDDQEQKADRDNKMPLARKDAGGEGSEEPAQAPVDPLHQPSKEDDYQQQKADANKNLSPSSNDDAGERSSEIPGDILSRDPSSVQSPLKRKREEKARPKPTFSVKLNPEADDDLLQSGPEAKGKYEDSSEDDQVDFKTTKLNPSAPMTVKRDRIVRRQDRSNRSEKNWTAAMKRHWNTKQKDIAMGLITIKRDQIQEVNTH
jgi:hypothetical protein